MVASVVCWVGTTKHQLSSFWRVRVAVVPEGENRIRNEALEYHVLAANRKSVNKRRSALKGQETAETITGYCHGLPMEKGQCILVHQMQHTSIHDHYLTPSEQQNVVASCLKI